MKKYDPIVHVILGGAWFFWIVALVLYLASPHLWDWLTAGGISLLMLIFYFFHTKTRCFIMFSKKKTTVPPTIEAKDKKFIPSTDRNLHCTVIARGTEFIGNIEGVGDIQVYGKICGNISVKEGTIRIMQAGMVEGELDAPEIIIDGSIEGTGAAYVIEILEHGELRGTSRSSSLLIKRGGVFIGQSEWLEDLVDGGLSHVVEFKHSAELESSDELMTMNNSETAERQT